MISYLELIGNSFRVNKDRCSYKLLHGTKQYLKQSKPEMTNQNHFELILMELLELENHSSLVLFLLNCRILLTREVSQTLLHALLQQEWLHLALMA